MPVPRAVLLILALLAAGVAVTPAYADHREEGFDWDAAALEAEALDGVTEDDDDPILLEDPDNPAFEGDEGDQGFQIPPWWEEFNDKPRPRPRPDLPVDDTVAAARRRGLVLRPDGTVRAWKRVPVTVRRVIAAANRIAHTPYRYGGGHGSFSDTAYDCSGSVSYALHGAGLLSTALVSGQLASWGSRGRGKWITIYANDGHVFMVVGGLRYDTSGRTGYETRWQPMDRSTSGFAVRHPTGL